MLSSSCCSAGYKGQEKGVFSSSGARKEVIYSQCSRK